MKRDEQIYIRLSDAEKRELETTAAMYGYEMSDFIRRMTRWVRVTKPALVIEPENTEKEPTL